MSYAIGLRAASLAAVAVAVSAKFDDIVAAQPEHARVRPEAEAALDALLAQLQEPAEGFELELDMSGASYGEEGEPLKAVSLSIRINQAEILA